jgi:poly(3-hydroxybutyrate) depolymerase
MFRIRRALALVVVAVSLGGGTPAPGQTLPPGPQVLSFFSDVDDTEQPYGLYLPRNFDPKKKYPLVVMLHGAGSNHRLSLRRVFGKSNAGDETDVEATRYFPSWKDVDFVVASPYARGTMGYQSVAERDVYDVVADVKRRFPIDEDRVYLTGLSMGGGGTLWLGLSRPDVWAAIAPVCPAPPVGTWDLAPNALNIPVHIFHGDADPVVEPAGVRDWVKRFEELGTRVQYTEYPGVKHDSWVNAYADEAVFGWFAQFRRNRFPDRVRFVTTRYKYPSAYWVRVDALTPGTVASVDARFTAPNRIEVTTNGVDGFTLNLAGHPKFKSGRQVDATVDGKAVAGSPADSLSFVRRDGVWVAGRYEPPAGSKRAGSEGPIGEAIASRHVYVYGTAGNPSREEVQARRVQAEQAANWSAYRGAFLNRVMVFPRVAADTEVRTSDFESANLVLFGTKETNSVIAKYADRLPLELNPSAADYGLVYVFPAAGRYVVVSSGLPWWTGAIDPLARPAPPTGRRTFTPLGGPPGMLWSLGDADFVVFKGSAESVVARGQFDTAWRLSAQSADALRSTGAVTVQAGAR